MTEERILSLDISTKTGWALLISGPAGPIVGAYGQVPPIHMPDGPYPQAFVEWAYSCFKEIVILIDRFAPDVLVIEETSAGSKAIYTQKILEFIHFLVARYIRESGIRAIYLLTEQWRRETGCQMSKQEKKQNTDVKKYKDKNNTRVAYDKEGKRTGKITRKHVNIRRANELFEDQLTVPLRKKDEDTADSLMLAYCYHLRRLKMKTEIV